VSGLLTISETAALLRCTPAAIYKRLERRQLPFIRIGRSLLVRREELERFLIDHTVEARS
jgi:excisionase family DNA binding protein